MDAYQNRIAAGYERMLAREWEEREEAADRWNEAVAVERDAICDDSDDFAEVASQALCEHLRSEAGDGMRDAILDAITGRTDRLTVLASEVARIVERALDAEAERRAEMKA